jgi:hypothetical protein
MSQRRLAGGPSPLDYTQPMFPDGVRKELTVVAARAMPPRLALDTNVRPAATSRT